MQSPATISLHTGQKRSVLVDLLLVGGFALLTGVGAQIEIPHQPVPYTLQTMFVLLSGALLGKRNGALSQLCYLAAGVAGLPVFSGMGFGLARILGPTGGYLLAFPAAAFTVGYLRGEGKSFVRTIVAMAAGLFVIFSLGTLQLNLVLVHDLPRAFAGGFLIFSWWDLLKLAAAATIAHQLRGRIPSGGIL
jgi:biotin transport system substrate-specific component